MAELTVPITLGTGLGDLRFGMDETRARAALAAFGEIKDGTAPGGSLTLYTEGADPSFSVYANFVPDGRLFTLEIFRPDDSSAVDLELAGVPAFGSPVDEVLQALRAGGYEVDDEDEFHPVVEDGYLGVSLEGGDDGEEEDDDPGPSRFIQSLLIAPRGYATEYTNAAF
ncbi:hypothetical protein KOI35_43880 [Actinoplanes bogorensis]|uniref:Uncharacterized protein n=1 Tax=Paractinoplanes bogorensis TaxID=1610840 RepID=A0ABS5Z446_9ACTN|nr:hypothetical protein [Actinoplanes bogorensis]MBU2670464.1 hypothetical protein [Actinoplanes bogorensis]